MKKSFLYRFAFCLFALPLILTSCGKENKETIEEIVEEFNPSMLLTINGVSNEISAYAAYCNVDSIESFSVSNNPAILDNDLWTGLISEGDFVIHYKKDPTLEFTLSGAVFNLVDPNGESFIGLTQGLDNDIIIDEANNEQIIGSMSGEFLINLATGETAPYEVEFAAVVDPNKIPVYCQ